MNHFQLAAAVRAALTRAVAAGDLAVMVPDTITLDRPRSRDHGDYATPVALELAGTAGLAPRRIAAVLAGHLSQENGICDVDVAGPGFVNIRLDIAAAGAPVGEVIAAGSAYGSSEVLRGRQISLVFAAADPIGPVFIGDARRAAVGDALGRVLATQGATVVRQYLPAAEEVVIGPKVFRLEDLIDSLGVDAARYWLIRSTVDMVNTVDTTRDTVDTTLEPDLDLWTKQIPDNPVFHVRFAHAQLAALARSARDLGIDLGTDYDPALLNTPQESELIALLAAYPQVLTKAADSRAPHRIARYLEDLASGYDRFHEATRVLPMGDEAPGAAHVARLWLCAAVRQVLANGLAVLGVSAPERL